MTIPYSPLEPPLSWSHQQLTFPSQVTRSSKYHLDSVIGKISPGIGFGRQREKDICREIKLYGPNCISICMHPNFVVCIALKLIRLSTF